MQYWRLEMCGWLLSAHDHRMPRDWQGCLLISHERWSLAMWNARLSNRLPQNWRPWGARPAFSWGVIWPAPEREACAGLVSGLAPRALRPALSTSTCSLKSFAIGTSIGSTLRLPDDGPKCRRNKVFSSHRNQSYSIYTSCETPKGPVSGWSPWR